MPSVATRGCTLAHSFRAMRARPASSAPDSAAAATGPRAGPPVAEDLPGRVLAEAFTADFRARRGRVRVDTWGSRDAASEATTSPADASRMEQLRGLGYIE